MRRFPEIRKAICLFSLFLFLLLLGFTPFHQYAAHNGEGHHSADCAICMASSQLAGLVIALIIFPSCLLPFFPSFFCHVRPKPGLVPRRLPQARAPPRLSRRIHSESS